MNRRDEAGPPPDMKTLRFFQQAGRGARAGGTRRDVTLVFIGRGRSYEGPSYENMWFLTWRDATGSTHLMKTQVFLTGGTKRDEAGPPPDMKTFCFFNRRDEEPEQAG